MDPDVIVLTGEKQKDPSVQAVGCVHYLNCTTNMFVHKLYHRTYKVHFQVVPGCLHPARMNSGSMQEQSFLFAL